jgi:spectinomycin phosphotransferase
VPHRLIGNGVDNVPAPMTARDGALSTTVGRFAVIVYPFAATRTGMQVGLTGDQWTAFGHLLRQVHETSITPDLELVLERDGFEPDGAATIDELDAHISAGSFSDAAARAIAEFWMQRRDQILGLRDTARALGGRLRLNPPPFVLCHADAHTNNVLVGDDGRIWLVDWDGTVLAPRERDLMFVIGGIGPGWVSAEQEAAFMSGYGSVVVDGVALAHYRYSWAIGDIASYGDQIFRRPDLGPADHADAVDKFMSLFDRGSIVDIALGSPI